MNFIEFISWNSDEELVLAIHNTRYYYFGVSKSLANEIEYKIKQGYNGGRILADLRKYKTGIQKYVPLKVILAQIWADTQNERRR